MGHGEAWFVMLSYLQLGEWLQQYTKALWHEGELKRWATLALAAVKLAIPSGRRHPTGAWRS